MADTKISAMTAASTLAGPEVVAGVQSSDNVKISGDQIAALTLGPALNSLSAIGSLSSSAKIPAYQSGAGSITVAQLVSAAKQLGLWYNLATSAVSATLTGTTSEVVIATVTVPAGAMGANGALEAVVTIQSSSSASTKTSRIRFGGIGGTAYMSNAVTTTPLTMQHYQRITNANSQAVQVGGFSSTVGGFQGSGSAPVTGALDTSTNTTLVITGQLTSAADTITVSSYTVRALYQA